MSGTISLSSISSNSPEMATVLLEWNTTIAPTTYTIFLVQTDLTNDASANCPDFFRSISGTITSGATDGSIYVTVDGLESNTKYLASAQVRLGVGTTTQSTFLQTSTTTNLITTMAQPSIYLIGTSPTSVTVAVNYELGGCYYALPDKVQFYYTDGTTIQTKLFEDPYNLIENDFVINGLTKDTTYLFSCEIANEAGFSEISNSISATPSDIPFPPQDVTATLTNTNYGRGAITVMWAQPSSGSVPVSSYEIYDASSNTLLGTVTGSTYSFLFDGSNNPPPVLGKYYKFYVIAVGFTGDSEPSKTTRPDVLFATVPNVVTDLSANSSKAKIVVTWSPPVGNSGSNVYTYDLQYKLSTDVSYNPIVTGVTSPYTITSGLIVGQTYNIRVRADNSIGNGNWTTVNVKVITDPNPPVIRIVSPEFGRSDSLLNNTDPNTIYNFNLAWSKPNDVSGVTVADYKVNWSYTPAGGVSDVSGSYLTLSSEGNYSIFIRPDILPDASGNRIGRGAYYKFTVQTISTDGAISIPSAPAYGQGFTRPPIIKNFTTTSGNTSAQLNWDASYNLSAYPNSATAAQTGWLYDTSGNYKITVTDPSNISTNYYTSDSSYNVTGLTNGKKYNLTLQPNFKFFLPTPQTNPVNNVQTSYQTVIPNNLTTRGFDATGLLFDAAGPVFESAPVVSKLVNGQYNVRVLVRSDIPMKRVVSLAVAENDSVPSQIIQKSDINNEIEEGLYEYNFVYDFPVVGALCFATNGADLTTSSPTFPPE
jgi:Fibronectin type III domain